MGSALVTGATSGIGLEFAWELAAERNDLVLVARNEKHLATVAENIRQVANVQVEVLPADLATESGARAVAERVSAEERPIGLLINNAGFGLGQEFIGGSLERELEALDAMVRAVLITSHAATQTMVGRGYGAILNVASIASWSLNGTYSAHKAWVRTFTEGLAASLKGTGVSATALCPGLVRTEFHERAHIDADAWFRFAFSSPRTVARIGLDACRKGRPIVTPTLLYKAAELGLRLAPRPVVRLVAGPNVTKLAGAPQ